MKEFKFLVEIIEQVSDTPTVQEYLSLRAFVSSELLLMERAHDFAESSGTTLSRSEMAYLELLRGVSRDLSSTHDGGIAGAIFNAQSTARCDFHQWGLAKE
ncbi:hypothetical protein [Plesiomonas shigelloides]|uniref:hypothetical protein n=1 Tax=Plesiomonas shigelloides TaxID=703 RepID=UPI00387F12FD